MEWALLFAVGTIWFWVLTAVAVFLLFYCVEADRGFFATLWIVIFFVVMYFFGGFNVLSYIFQNPLISLGCAAGYVVAGTLWSMGKWWFYTHSQRRIYDELKEDFLKSKGVTDKVMPDHLKKDWKEKHSEHSGRRYEYNPQAKKHKGQLTLWGSYWPLSMVWTLINDPVKSVFEYVYARFQRTYQRISDKAFQSAEGDLS